MSTSTSDWNKTSFSIQVMRRVLHGEYDFCSGRVLSLQNGTILAIIKRTNKSFEVYRVESNYKRDINPRPNFQEQKKYGYLYLYALVSRSGSIFMVNYLLVNEPLLLTRNVYWTGFIGFGFIEWCTCMCLLGLLDMDSTKYRRQINVCSDIGLVVYVIGIDEFLCRDRLVKDLSEFQAG
jgi:hypothetical protein